MDIEKHIHDLQSKPDMHWTENVLLASYMRYRGIKQVYVHRIRKGKGIFYFEVPLANWDILIQEYDNSPELKFEHCRVDTINLTYA